MSAYDDAVLADKPVLYLASASTVDSSGKGYNATVKGSPKTTTLPNGDTAYTFPNNPRGTTGHYLQVPDASDFSVSRSGPNTGLSIELWINPTTAPAQPNDNSDHAVNFISKADGGQYEWEMRYYGTGHNTSDGNPVGTICQYVFNLSGGLGSGYDDTIGLTAGQWHHFVGVIQTAGVTVGGKSYPNGVVQIYRNGVLKNTGTLSAESSWGKPQTNPGNGTAPVRIGYGTESGDPSWFYGGMGKIAIYPIALSGTRISAHYSAMSAANTTPPPTSTPPPSGAPPVKPTVTVFPHGTVDPDAPVDGAIWIRDDTGSLSWQAGGTIHRTL